MTANGNNGTLEPTLAEIESQYGLAPILRSENPKRYVAMYAQFMACLQPKDFVVRWLIKNLVDDAWLMNRYQRHQTLSIERQYQTNVDFQVKRITAQNARREDTASKIAARATEQPTDIAHAVHLEDTFLESVTDLDEILDRIPSEHDHNRALRQTMEFHESMDRLHNNAAARLYRTFEQIEDYSEALGKRLREAHERIVDADYRVLEGPLEPTSAPDSSPPANSETGKGDRNLEEADAPPLTPEAGQTHDEAHILDEGDATRSAGV
jgi:hypothetical protein